MDLLVPIAKALQDHDVQFIVIGVWGANYYAQSAATVFSTHDCDVFLPPDPANLLRAWQACEAESFALWSGNEPLDRPRDLLLARRVVEFRAVTTAISETGTQVDLSLVMGNLTFRDVWPRRRMFTIEHVSVPVASLADIIASKAAAGRPKDLLFLATYEEALKDMMRDAGDQGRRRDPQP